MYKTIEQMCDYNKVIGRGYDENGVPRAFDEREFFQVVEEMGWNQNNPDYRRLFEELAIFIKNLPQVTSSLELGCGSGYLVNCLNKAGVKTVGVDSNRYSKKIFDSAYPALADNYILDPTFSKRYPKADLVIAIECFEHIPDALLVHTMEKISREIQPTFFLFSSTPFPDPCPGWDIQWGHINLKTPLAWEAFFSRYGFVLTKQKPPVTEWAGLYERVVG